MHSVLGKVLVALIGLIKLEVDLQLRPVAGQLVV